MASQRAVHEQGHPGRKRLGDEVLVPVTMKVEPSELATIGSIARYSHRSRSDVMREMLSYGLAHVMGEAFGGGSVSETNCAAARDAGERVVSSALLTPEELDVVDALGASGMGSRSAVVRRAVEEGLRLSSMDNARGVGGLG